VESVASILLTLLVIALVLAFAQGGTAGVGKWFHAKFVGE
jgi:hypothetical protein